MKIISNQKNLNSVDIVYLIMALLVIGIHSYIFENKRFSDNLRYLL